jgi:hypothetical protein
MAGSLVLGLALLLWGVATVLTALFKPKAIWRMGKIQGFVQVLTETGAVIFFSTMGAVAIAAGIIVLLR